MVDGVESGRKVKVCNVLYYCG